MGVKKYRKKPVVVEAIQLKWENWGDICEFVPKPYFIKGVFLDEYGRPHDDFITCDRIVLLIKTLEGEMLAVENDYIIKGVNGEFYPCKPDIFEKTYEEEK